MDRPTQRSRRLNLRALVILVVVVVVGIPAVVGIKVLVDRLGRNALLREAKTRLEKKEPARALGYLNRYLELNPSDTDALDLKGKVFADAAQTEAQAKEAATALDYVIGRDPNRREARRRLVKMNLRIHGMARAAETQARELIQRGDDDAEAHRLLASALEQIGAENQNVDVLEEARQEYEKAEKKEPGDVGGAERLATLYRDRLDKPEPAQTVLDQLVEYTAKTPKTHAAALLARSRHWSAARQPAKAEADVDAALKEDPDDIDVRLAASEVAVQHRDTTTARLHLKSITEKDREDLRVKVAQGLIDLAEDRPDDAIQTWRAGLVRSGGSDVELTWKLAYVLLQVGRVAEAEPLVEQFRRLSGGETPTPAARYLRGLAFLKGNHPAEAIAELEPVRYKIDKRLETDLCFALGQAYERVREGPKALEAYLRAAELSREWSGPWVAAARLQAATNPADAVTTLRRGLTLNPGDPRMVALLAQVVWRIQAQKPEKERSWDEVERALADAKQAAPGSPDVALVEAEYLMARKKPDDAIGLLEVATRLHPRSSELWLARANALARNGRLAQAIAVTDQAVTAAGPQAGFYVTRASLLILKGEVNKARDAMVEGISRVPKEQQPTLWKALGDFYQIRKDPASAKAAFREWAKLQPENPDPWVALFELALAAGDDAAIAEAIAEVKKVGGPKAYYWRYAQVEDLLRPRGGSPPDAARLTEAQKLVAEIQADQPQLPIGFLLEGRVRESQKQTDKAIAAYEKALTLNAGAAALNPLVTILTREHRDAALDRLRETIATLPGDLDRLAAVQALRVGNKGRAEQLAAMAVQGDPQGVDVRIWQAEVLQALGKPDEAEAALKVLTAQRPSDAAPWLQLLMLQLSRRQASQASATIEQIRTHVKTEFPELLWAQCYRAAGDGRRAAECYREALRRWPDDLNVLTSAIAFYDQTGRRDEAEAGLRTILRRDKSNGWATRVLAQSLANRAGNVVAWKEALDLIGAEPMPNDVPDDLLARAAVYAQGPLPAHRAKALAILLGLLNELPDLPTVHEKAARLLFAEGPARLAEAKEHAAKAAASDRATPDAILFYAGVLLASKDVTEAEAQLARLVAIDPDGLPVAELKARILTAQGKPKEAAECLEQAFADRAATPQAPSVGEKMVHLLSTPPLNQPEAAERVARKLAETSPKGQCALAELLAARGKLDDASALLEQAAKTGDPVVPGSAALNLATASGADPRWLPMADRFLAAAAKEADTDASIDLLEKQALVRHLQRRYAEEVALYQAALEKGPQNFLFLNNLAWTLSEEMGKPDQGRKWADEAIRRAGDLPHIRDTRGVILTRLGDFDGAIKDLEAAARGLPSGPVYYHLARAYNKAKRPDDARKCRDLAKKSGLARDQLQASELADWDSVMKP